MFFFWDAKKNKDTFFVPQNQGWGAEPGVFGSLEPEPLEKKGAGAGAAWKKTRSRSRALEKNLEPEPLEKKLGARVGAAKKFAGSPAQLKSVLGVWSFFKVIDFGLRRLLNNTILSF